MLWKVRRGETEYGIGPIPLGGYVRITGMNPNEEIPPEVAPRAYYNQPVWKRIVVILAGPAVNLLIAFGIIWALFLSNGENVPSTKVAQIVKASPAAATLHLGDQILSVDGVSSSPEAMRNQLATHTCAGAQVNGCVAKTPAVLRVLRANRTLVISVKPRYNAADNRPLVGFSFGDTQKAVGAGDAASLAVTGMWKVTKQTVSVIVRIFEPQERKQLSGVVGGYTVTQESFATSTTLALQVLALISLSLAVINLFPFLPLDGGHVFWALAEKVRGRRIPFEVMERAGIVGFALILLLFVVGLSNDISTLSGKGFNVR
jgi:regulator of sigma E protease